MTEKMFYGDRGTAYRAQEMMVSPELLADDKPMLAMLRSVLAEHGAVILRVLPPVTSATPDTP
jgi:hypothetical protein